MKTAITPKIVLFLAIGIVSSTRAEIPLPLDEALKNEKAQAERWAYTETEVTRDGQGTQKSITVVRYDPSKPYAEQYTPLTIDGAPPTKKALKKYRDRGEQEAAARQKQQGQNDDSGKSPVRIDLNGAKGIIDFEQAGVTEENEHSLTYNIPIRTEGKSSFPFDKIQVLVRVNKQQHAFENLDLKVLAPFRLKVIAKVKGAEISADYTTVDADHPPQASHINVHAKVGVLFGAFDVHQEITRTDFKPVKPYDERFSVKAGPLKTLGF